MIILPTGAGLTAVPAFAEESGIVEFVEEDNITTDENVSDVEETPSSEGNDIVADENNSTEETTSEETDIAADENNTTEEELPSEGDNITEETPILEENTEGDSETYSVAVTVNDVSLGTAFAEPNEAVEAGTEVTLTYSENENGKFVGWSITPDTVIITDNKFTMPEENVTVEATFAEHSYVFTVMSLTEVIGEADTWKEAAEYITDPSADYTVKIASVSEIDNFVIPKTANSITFTGSGRITMANKKLAIPVNTTFDVYLTASNYILGEEIHKFIPDIAVTVAAGKKLINDGITVYELSNSYSIEDDVCERVVGSDDTLDTIEEAMEILENNPTKNYEIEFHSDMIFKSFNVPKKFKGALVLTNSIGGAEIKFDGLSSIQFNCPVRFNYMSLNSTKKFNIVTTNDVYIFELTATNLDTLKGNSQKSLTVNTTHIDYNIAGFGNVHLDSPVVIDSKLSCINLGANDEFNRLYLDDDSVININNIVSTEIVEILFYENAAPITISGTVTAPSVVLESENDFDDGQLVMTAPKADISKFVVDPDSCPDKRDYVLSRVGKNIYIRAVALGTTDGTDSFKFATWADFTSFVNEEKAASTDYVVSLTGDYNVGGPLTMPKAGTYKSITITSVPNEEGVTIPLNFNFTGNLVLTASTTFSGVNIGAVKNGEPAKYTINSGKNAINILASNTGMLTSINGTGFVGLFYANAEKIKAGDLYIGGEIEAIGGITAKNVIINENTDLFMT